MDVAFQSKPLDLSKWTDIGMTQNRKACRRQVEKPVFAMVL